MDPNAIQDSLLRFLKHDGARAFYNLQSYYHAFSESASNSFLNNQISDLSIFQALLLLTILIVSWKILIYTINQVVGWIIFFFKLALVTALVVSACYIYTVGVEAFLRDLGWALGLIDGFVLNLGSTKKQQRSWYSGR